MIGVNASVVGILLAALYHPVWISAVFTHKDGKEIYLEHLSDRIFKEAMTRAGVSKIKFHNLRSTFAANFCMSGGDIYTLSKILGHSKVDMTAKRYAHLHSSHMKRAVEIIAFEANGSQMAHGKFELIASN